MRFVIVSPRASFLITVSKWHLNNAGSGLVSVRFKVCCLTAKSVLQEYLFTFPEVTHKHELTHTQISPFQRSSYST